MMEVVVTCLIGRSPSWSPQLVKGPISLAGDTERGPPLLEDFALADAPGTEKRSRVAIRAGLVGRPLRSVFERVAVEPAYHRRVAGGLRSFGVVVIGHGNTRLSLDSEPRGLDGFNDDPRTNRQERTYHPDHGEALPEPLPWGLDGAFGNDAPAAAVPICDRCHLDRIATVGNGDDEGRVGTYRGLGDARRASRTPRTSCAAARSMHWSLLPE
jgi:hypothetical protein